MTKLSSQEELVRRTQELFDAVAPGNQAPWKEYFAEDAVYFDEKGRNMDKAALVADVTPLPKGENRWTVNRASSRDPRLAAYVLMVSGGGVAVSVAGSCGTC